MSDKLTEFWGVLELMGHVRLAGRISEETKFGTALGRIDIPMDGDKFLTQFFAGSSIYRLTPCDEQTARAVAAHNAPQPIHRFEMPQIAHAASVAEQDEYEPDDEDEDDERPF